LIELSLGDRLNLLEDAPLDSLSAGWGGQRSIVAVELVEIERVKEAFHIDLLVGPVSLGSLKSEYSTDLVEEQVVTIASLLSIEENANYGTKTGVFFVKMHKVDFEIVVVTIDSVLGG
jgi:hypothetical protein